MSKRKATPSPPPRIYHDPNDDLPAALVIAARENADKHVKTFGLADVVKVGTYAVEQFSAAQQKAVPGTTKLELCKQILPVIIQECVENGSVDSLKAMRLQARIDSGLDMIDDLINAFVAVSKNPHFIQFREEIAEKCCVKKARKTSDTTH